MIGGNGELRDLRRELLMSRVKRSAGMTYLDSSKDARFFIYKKYFDRI